MAPYQIILNDGRLIFAPQDNDQVIKLRPPRTAEDTSPPSPDIDELLMSAGYDDEEEEGGEGNM